MLNIILPIISIIIIIIMLASKMYEDCKEVYEKIIIIMYVLIIIFPAIILILDFSNIPSKFINTNAINIQNWLGYIMNYLGTVISAIIGAIVAVYVTIYQINKNNKDNEKRDKENLRIQNMPLLEYTLDTFSSIAKKEEDIIETGVTKTNERMKYLNLNIKNIGLGCVKNCAINLESDIFKLHINLIDNKSPQIIKINESKSINKIIYLEAKSYQFTLNVYYEDLLDNWYLQKVKINYNTSDSKKSYCTVEKETLIKIDEEQKLKEMINME